jgi:hypothetical protein
MQRSKRADKNTIENRMENQNVKEKLFARCRAQFYVHFSCFLNEKRG